MLPSNVVYVSVCYDGLAVIEKEREWLVCASHHTSSAFITLYSLELPLSTLKLPSFTLKRYEYFHYYVLHL